MIDVVVWEAVISVPGLCVLWQHFFSPGYIISGACFGRSMPQRIILPSFISFYEFLPGSGFFWDPANVFTRYI
jgi:hypothetical protein